eukprot:gene5480-6032_t
MNYFFVPSSLQRLQEEEAEETHSSRLSSYEYDEEFEMLVAAFLRDMDYTTVNQTALNIIYSMINAGIISLPYAASQGGIPFYAIIVILISIMSAYTSIMVISMANEQKVRTLEDLAECAFGPRGFFAVSFFQILFSFALMAITLDVFTDIMVDVFHNSPYQYWILTDRIGQLLLGSVVVIPLCLMKTSMSSMRWTSYVTVCALIAALVAVITTYLADSNKADTIITSRDLLEEKVMTVYSSLRQRSVPRWQRAVKKAYFVLIVLYLFFGIFGYIAIRRMGNDLSNVNFFLSDGDERKVIFDPVRVMVAFSLLLTIPVDCLVATTTWRRFFSKYMKLYQYTHAINQYNHNQTTGGGVGGVGLGGIFDKCFWRVTIVSMSTQSSQAIYDALQQGGESVVGNVANGLPRNPSLPPSPARFNRRSRGPYLSRADSSQSSSHQPHEFLSHEDGTVSRLTSARTSREVDEAGWSMYSNPLRSDEKKSKVSHDHGSRTVSFAAADDMALDGSPSRCGVSALRRTSPALVLYVLCFLTCLGVPHWLYLAASVCTLSTAILLFIFPSILYFRLGLTSDYQSIPLIFNILPNQVYMYIIQITGIVFILFDVLLLCYFFVRGEHFVQSRS